MNLSFCGGAGEVGASCILLKIAGKNIVLDVGMRMGKTKDLLPDFQTIQAQGGVEAIIISHAHMDHIGALPILSNAYPQARIYLTHATKDLIQVLLYDSLKIMEQREQEIPMYAEVHVKNALDRMICYSPGYIFHPFGKENDLAVTLYAAGHVLGATAIYLTAKEGSLFYSGDFSITPQETVNGAAIPKLRPDLAIFESTYGDRLHSNRKVETERLIEKVKEVILTKKKILIPAFALGRAQEVILILKKAIHQGMLPECKVYVDGMVKDICRIYKNNPNYLKNTLAKKVFRDGEIFFNEHILPVTGKQAQREAIITSSEPCCIISSSGMLSGGPSQWYASKLALTEGNYIALTGYQDEEAPGRQLLELAEATEESERVLKFGELTIPVKCGIGKYGLSAHADKSEISALIHSLGARHVYLVHGDPTVISQLGKEIQTDYRGRIFAPSNGETFTVNPSQPRQQLFKKELLTLAKDSLSEETELIELWEFILNQYGIAKGFTIEDLLEIWYGKNPLDDLAFETLKRLINHSAHFEAELKRPFIFHAKAPETIETPPEFMEINAMLALVEEYFPPETGLYKKGANFNEQLTLLSFNFPAQTTHLETKFSEFETKTGWKIQLNQECHLAAAENLIQKLFGTARNQITKISYFALENSFLARTSNRIPNSEQIKAAFEQQTGVKLQIELNTNSKTTPRPPKALLGQMEQNQTLAIIEAAFRAQPDKIFKKSFKQANGSVWLELSFISPIVGERYQKLITELEQKTRWEIQINPTPNQYEISKIGRNLIEDAGIILKKNLAFMPKEMQILALIEPANTEVLTQITVEFLQLTGLPLVFK